MTRANPRSGVTMLEVLTVVALVGILSTVAVSQLATWMEHQRARTAARTAADIFRLARSEAIRTGRNHIVFFGPPGTTDAAGTTVTNGAGQWVPMLIVDDGPPDTANCKIDAGEEKESVAPVDGVTWGVSAATVRAPADSGGAPFTPPQTSGSTFSDPSNNPVAWVLFRPDGIPVGFSYAAGTCADVSGTGRGGGALYLTNGERDFGVVLSPLGGVRVHLFDPVGSWTS